MLGAKVLICSPRDPEAKGLVERVHDYLERSFLPGRAFASPADFNAQLRSGCALANTAPAPGVGLPPDRPDRRGPGRDAAAAAGGARDWLAGLAAAAARPLRPPGRQRLLGAPGGDRPPGRGASPTWTGSGCSATGGWSPTTSGSGPASDDHRPGPCRRRAVLRRDRLALPARSPQPEVEIRCLADYDTAAAAWTAGWRDGHAPTTKPRRGTVTAEVAFLTRALKAPTLRESVARLAERARAESWTPRGVPGRLPATRGRPPRESTAVKAGSAPPGSRPARAWRSSTSTTPAASNATRSPTSGTLDFVTAKDNVVFLGPPGTGKTHLAIGLAIRACQAGHRVLFATAARMGRPARRRPPRRPAASRAHPARPLPAARRRRGRLHPLRTRSREPVLPARLLPLRTGLA